MEKRRPLEGIKVADFSWIAAGPMVTKQLAEHGATVVKVESMTRPDILRNYIPMAGGIPGVNRCASFSAYNDSKYSIALKLSTPRGIEVAKRLIAWADIVIENFIPGTMEKWGLGYDDIRKFKPDVIMVRLSMQGQTGPRATQAGLGTMLMGPSGISEVTGWPDRDPVGIPTAYTDWIAPWYMVVAIIGALNRRKQTGKGMYIDCSQLEAGASFLSPAILDYTVNGRVQTKDGNRSPYAAPHGAYRCRGDDRWCAIATFTDDEWHSFCKVIGEPPWTKDSRFTTLIGRKKNEDELNPLVEAWTINFSPEEVMKELQAAGVAAGIVENGQDLHEDPQLKHRHHFWFLEHPEMGLHSYDGQSYRLTKTPGELTMPAPCLGQHTEYVCCEVMGMPDEEFMELLAEGVFE